MEMNAGAAKNRPPSTPELGSADTTITLDDGATTPRAVTHPRGTGDKRDSAAPSESTTHDFEDAEEGDDDDDDHDHDDHEHGHGIRSESLLNVDLGGDSGNTTAAMGLGLEPEAGSTGISLSQGGSASVGMNARELGPSGVPRNYEELPDDQMALKALIGTLRTELSQRDGALSACQEALSQIRASHEILVLKSAEWKDELEGLRAKVPRLKESLAKEQAAREEEEENVKNLRLRAEESRRAIMRLQGEQQGARAKAKQENRRSMGFGPPAGWNPSAIGGSLLNQDEEEAKELKKSKRATLAFGPGAGAAIAAAGRGHRRTASGGRGAISRSNTVDQNDSGSESERTSLAGGLRGLRLSGAPALAGSSTASGLVPPHSATESESRRSSWTSNKSPRSAPLELPDEMSMQQARNRPPVPPRAANRSASATSATGSDFGGSTIESGLAVPTRSGSVSPSQSFSPGLGSPIAEEDNEPNTATMNLMQAKAELSTRDREVQQLHAEVARLNRRVDEANEARQASEVCLRALREFIAAHDEQADASSGAQGTDGLGSASAGAGALKGVKLPPLPTDANADDEGEDSKSSANANKSWGLRLGALPQMMRKTPSPADAGEDASKGAPERSSTDEQGEVSPSGAPTSASSAAGLTFGSFWSRAASSSSGTAPPQSASATNGPSSNGLHRASVSSALSDASSAHSTATGTSSQTGGGLNQPPQSTAGTSPGSSFRGFSWFKTKRAAQDGQAGGQGELAGAGVTGAGAAEIEAHPRVASPPFASLDHNQVAVDRSPNPSPGAGVGADGSSIAQENGAQGPGVRLLPRPSEVAPSYRAQKALSRTVSVSDDDGPIFVPPAFD